MRQFLRRAGFALLGGMLVQLVAFLADALLGLRMFALALTLPGWVVVYAGRSSDPPWGLPVMLLTNALVYAPVIYLALYWRPFRRKEVLSIRAE